MINEEQGGFQELTGFTRHGQEWGDGTADAELEEMANNIRLQVKMAQMRALGRKLGSIMSSGGNGGSTGSTTTSDPIKVTATGTVYGKNSIGQQIIFKPIVRVENVKGKELVILQVAFGTTNNPGERAIRKKATEVDQNGNPINANVAYVDNIDRYLDENFKPVIQESNPGTPLYGYSNQYDFKQEKNSDGTKNFEITPHDEPDGVINYINIRFETYIIVTDYNDVKGFNMVVGVINWGYDRPYAQSPVSLPTGIITPTRSFSFIATQIISNSGYQSYLDKHK
jgi:hypothetical protein